MELKPGVSVLAYPLILYMLLCFATIGPICFALEDVIAGNKKLTRNLLALFLFFFPTTIISLATIALLKILVFVAKKIGKEE